MLKRARRGFKNIYKILFCLKKNKVYVIYKIYLNIVNLVIGKFPIKEKYNLYLIASGGNPFFKSTAIEFYGIK